MCIERPGNQRVIDGTAYFLPLKLSFIDTAFSCHCACSEPRRLGPGLCAQGCGQAGVPQVPQALHLVRAGEDRRQTHPVLRIAGSKELPASATRHGFFFFFAK